MHSVKTEVNEIDTKIPSADYIEISLISVKYKEKMVSSFKKKPKKLKIWRTTKLCWRLIRLCSQTFHLSQFIAEKWNYFKQAMVPKAMYSKYQLFLWTLLIVPTGLILFCSLNVILHTKRNKSESIQISYSKFLYQLTSITKLISPIGK